jgi:hypothetical protein
MMLLKCIILGGVGTSIMLVPAYFIWWRHDLPVTRTKPPSIPPPFKPDNKPAKEEKSVYEYTFVPVSWAIGILLLVGIVILLIVM